MAFLEGVYRVVGAIAPINQRLSRLRLNFVPANILLMIGLGAMAFASWSNIATVLQSRRVIDTPSLDRLLSGGRPVRNYVALQGRLMADARLAYGSNGSNSSAGNLELADYIWAPLLDDVTGRAILVQFPKDYAFPANGSEITVQGILRPVVSAVTRQLSQTKYVHAGVPIERRFMLVEGSRPGSLGFPAVMGTVTVLLVLALAWATLVRNVIFLPADEAPTGAAAAMFDRPSHQPVLVSATLTLDGKTRRFFTHMPAVVGRSDTGDTVLASHIETSSTFYGMKVQQHSGVWVLGIRAGSISEAEEGHVFWGRRKLRAVRVRYVSALTGAPERAVVATAGEEPATVYLRTGTDG